MGSTDGKQPRIGVIYPEDGVLDDEFWRCVPAGVTVHVTRIPAAARATEGKHVDAQQAIVEGPILGEAAATFSMIQPMSVALACTGMSFAKGLGYDQTICDRISKHSGSPATTTATAMVAALHTLGIQRIAVAAPYIEAVCQRMVRFFQANDFEIVSVENLGLRGMAIAEVSPHEVCTLAKRADRPEAQGLLIGCTNLRAVEVLEQLEQDLGKPVVSANQATMWHALKRGGRDPRGAGVGRLYGS